MENSFAALIRALRQRRRLTLGQLAIKSGVSKATLSRWESGQSLPRIPELMCALDGLDASVAQRAQCLNLLEAPRAVLAVRSDSDACVTISLGDMLFGLRQRAQLTQVEAARAAGVSRSLYAQWESDASRPDSQQLHAAAFALGAGPDELICLSRRKYLVGKPLERSRATLLDSYQQLFVAWELSRADRHLWGLTLLAGFGRLYRDGDADIGDIALVVANLHSLESSLGKKERSQRYGRAALALARRSREPLHFHLAAMIFEVHRHESGAPQERAAAMRDWQARFPTPKGQAYFLSFVARTLSAAAPDEAIRLSDASCDLVADDPSEYPCRLRDKGNLLRECGRFSEAVEFISRLVPQDNFRAALKEIDLACVLVELGSRNEAERCLDAARKYPNMNEFWFTRDKIAELELRLS